MYKRQGENSTWLVSEENAVLVEYDPADIADKMEYYLKHEEALEKIKDQGIAFAKTTSWEAEAKKVRDALKKGIEEDAG